MHYAAIDECSLVSTTGGGSPAQTVREESDKSDSKKSMDHDEDGDEKIFGKKNRTGGRRPLIIFGITLVTFYPRTTQTVEENGAAEPAQDVVTEETRHGVGHQAIRVE